MTKSECIVKAGCVIAERLWNQNAEIFTGSLTNIIIIGINFRCIDVVMDWIDSDKIELKI